MGQKDCTYSQPALWALQTIHSFFRGKLRLLWATFSHTLHKLLCKKYTSSTLNSAYLHADFFSLIAQSWILLLHAYFYYFQLPLGSSWNDLLNVWLWVQTYDENIPVYRNLLGDQEMIILLYSTKFAVVECYESILHTRVSTYYYSKLLHATVDL